MNRKIIMGGLAGVAAIALAVGGTTYSAFSDYGDTNNNTLGSGFLKLDLGANGTGNTSLDFGKMAPGPSASPDGTGRQIWIASNNGDSVPSANLFVTLHNLTDTPAPCDTSLGKASGEAASGVTGCSINGATATGTPAQGNLSRVLSFQGYYYPGITDPTACAQLNAGNGTYPSNRTSFFASGRGDLHSIATGTGTKYELYSSGTTPLVLNPGQGGCIGIAALWISNPATTGSPTAPTDDAAQGDSMAFDVHFDLVQDLTAPLPGPVQGP
jgi:predicted ribosomally synthesized peptide with SipW-like signal peptide